MYFLKNLLLYSQALIRQTKYVLMMTKEGSTKIVNFMTPGAGVLVLGCGHISHIVKMHYFFKNLLLNSQAQIRQTKQVVMMTKEGSNKIVNFMTPGAGVLVLEHGHISHIVKQHCFFNNLFRYSQAEIKQTKCIVIMTKVVCTRIVNSYKSQVNMYFLLLCQYTSH